MTVCTVVKSKGKISQNFAAFSEYMNFEEQPLLEYLTAGLVYNSFGYMYIHKFSEKQVSLKVDENSFCCVTCSECKDFSSFMFFYVTIFHAYKFQDIC